MDTLETVASHDICSVRRREAQARPAAVNAHVVVWRALREEKRDTKMRNVESRRSHVDIWFVMVVALARLSQGMLEDIRS